MYTIIKQWDYKNANVLLQTLYHSYDITSDHLLSKWDKLF